MCFFYSLQQIISNYMKTSTKIVTTIKDFKLVLTPRSIIFLKKNPHSFRLYIQKDLQVIGTVKQIVPPMTANKKYSFSEYNTPIQFRSVADKKSTYHIALYQLSASGVQQFVENSQLKFSKLLDEFYRQFLEIQQQLNTVLKGRQQLPIHQIWKNLSNNFTQKIFFNSVKFDKVDAILQLTIEPIHKYDEIVKEAELLQQKKREKKNKRIEDVYNKTKTISDFIPHDSDSTVIKRGQTENQLQMLKPFSFQDKRQSFNKSKVKQDLKSFNFNFNHKTNDESTAVQQRKEQGKQNQSTNDYKNENKDVADANQMKKNENEAPQIKETIEKDEQNSVKPNISVENEKYLVSPQRKFEYKKTDPQILNPGPKTGDRGVNPNKTWKQNIVLSFVLFISLGFGYFLMHPLPKV